MRDGFDSEGFGRDLLHWYDTAARDLPWRVAPRALAEGARPDPYRVWLSEVMLQQTTVAAVKGYFDRFIARWPDVRALAGAADAEVMAEWAGLGYYARARNLLACARKVTEDHGGAFPDTAEGLRTLPGIGPYTAAAIAAIAFDRPAPVVDGNVERVVARLFGVTDPLPGSKRRLAGLAGDLTPERRPGDHAQAMMDLGATICTPRRPVCGACPVARHCRGHAAGIAERLPMRTERTPKPVRRGFAYVARRTDGAVLLETRAPRGLLGGMLGWPCSDWSEAPEEAPPLAGDWRDPKLEVRHTFTHFHLILHLRISEPGLDARPQRGGFVQADVFRPAALPTVMRKCWDIARAGLGRG
ncbi:MAG: A/G-specific adenine glycosylase [Gemmobacter sp.]